MDISNVLVQTFKFVSYSYFLSCLSLLCDRYQKNKDWRSTVNSQVQRPRPLVSSLLSKHGSFAKSVAPEARFLNLLEANRKNCSCIKLKQGSKGVFRSPPENFPTVPVTLADGSRVYIRSSVRNRSESTVDNAKLEGSCALGVSMKELFRRVDGMRRRKIAMGQTTERAKIQESKRDSHDMLWVDKHAPKSFPDLLSDERTNREVLRALRRWDPYVFGKAPPLRPLYQRQREQETETEAEKEARNGDKRPEENARVILLSGPPGVGT